MTCGEAAALYWFIGVTREYAAAYCVLATILKDKVHNWLEK